jgi:hypothetical protein
VSHAQQSQQSRNGHPGWPARFPLQAALVRASCFENVRSFVDSFSNFYVWLLKRSTLFLKKFSSVQMFTENWPGSDIPYRCAALFVSRSDKLSRRAALFVWQAEH